MGFEAGDTLTTYKLTFEEYPGLEVTAREPSVGQLMALNATGGRAAAGPGPEAVEAAFRLLAELLVSWNVTRAGEPVPAGYDGIVTLGTGVVLKIIKAIGDAVGTVDPTSPPGSGDGPGSVLEASIPMTPVTPASPPSS